MYFQSLRLRSSQVKNGHFQGQTWGEMNLEKNENVNEGCGNHAGGDEIIPTLYFDILR